MENLILVLLIALILFCAVFYIFNSKKKGKKCIGCPYSGECGKRSCGNHKN